MFYLACCFYNLVKILQLIVHSINFITEMRTKYCESPERNCKTFPNEIRRQASYENSVPQGQRRLFPVKNGCGAFQRQKSHTNTPDSGRRVPSRKTGNPRAAESWGIWEDKLRKDPGRSFELSWEAPDVISKGISISLSLTRDTEGLFK